MRTVLCVIFLFAFFFGSIEAKDKRFACESSFDVIVKDALLYDRQYNIYMANNEGLTRLMEEYNDKDLIVLVSSSTSCGGTPNALNYINNLIKSKYNVKYIFVLGDDLKNCKLAPIFFQSIDSQVLRVLPMSSYRAKGDNRRRADDLLKDVFPEVKNDLIGTPKFYIFRPQTKELLFHGFRYYKNPYSEDIVRYFLEDIKK
jgi:hypothetical protein